MILIDANLLIYAYDSASLFHEPARDWIEETFSAPQPACLSWSVALAFLRITTDRRILTNPFSIGEAAAIVDSWLALSTVRLLTPGERHWEILHRLVTGDQASGALVPDAHLAALAIEHGAILQSTDRDFSRFQGLRWENPLQRAQMVNEGG